MQSVVTSTVRRCQRRNEDDFAEESISELRAEYFLVFRQLALSERVQGCSRLAGARETENIEGNYLLHDNESNS